MRHGYPKMYVIEMIYFSERVEHINETDIFGYPIILHVLTINKR